MRDVNEFPETLLEAIKYFADPDVALNFMVSMRWPDGVKCPRCGSVHVSFASKRRLWTCEDCPNRRQFSIKVGTIMEDSPLGLDKWIVGMWLIMSAKNGISSYELHRTLGITQKSAWFLGHRIRFSLQSGSLEKVAPKIVESMADEKGSAEDVARLLSEWQKKRPRGVNIAAMSAHPIYQSIIALGWPAVPALLSEMKRNPGHWFPALHSITGVNPIQPEDEGKLNRMAKAWIQWGKDRGYELD